MKDSTSDILLVLVNFFHEEEVLQFLDQQVKTQSTRPVGVIIVDNGSENISGFRKMAEAFPSVFFVDAGFNRGYLGAFFYGLEQYRIAGHRIPSLVLLSNTDMVWGATLLSEIAERWSERTFAIAGPHIQAGNNKNVNQNPFLKQRISLKKLKFLRFIYSFYVLYICYQLLAILKRSVSVRKTDTDETTIQEIYAIHGSFMIVHSTFLLQLENHKGSAPFLFGEEIFLAEMAARLRLPVYYDPALFVRHMEHSTTGQFKSRFLVGQFYKSTVSLIRNFFTT